MYSPSLSYQLLQIQVILFKTEVKLPILESPVIVWGQVLINGRDQNLH